VVVWYKVWPFFRLAFDENEPFFINGRARPIVRKMHPFDHPGYKRREKVWRLLATLSLHFSTPVRAIYLLTRIWKALFLPSLPKTLEWEQEIESLLPKRFLFPIKKRIFFP